MRKPRRQAPAFAGAGYWLSAHGAQYKTLNPVYLGDDLFSRQPICEAVLAEGGHFLFVCKPDSHPAIEDFLPGIVPETMSKQVRIGKKRVTYRYRWLNDVPLRGDEKSIQVNWFAIEIVDAKGVVTYRNSFISDLPVHRDNVAAMAAAGRARWKACPRVGGDRERGLQHAENQGLQSRAQFRARPPVSLVRAGDLELAGVRLSHGLRSGR